ncbi:MAG: NUDIX hydrolase [Candidatus Abyssubacteria bacterium]
MKPMKDFEIKKSEQIYSGRVVGLSRELIVLPNGREVTREVVQHPGAVAIVPMLSSSEVVLLRQFRYPAKTTLWEVPAGTLEPSEGPRACAHRELIEETGYRAGKMEPMGGFFTSPGFCNEFLHMFVATDLVLCESDPDQDERLEVHTLSLDEALRKIETGEIVDAKTLVGLLMVDRMMSKPR